LPSRQYRRKGIKMNKIASFTVNHLKLIPGVYVSRKDTVGQEVITTFDLRFTTPNTEPPMDNPGIHSIEHLVATFLRNHPTWSEKTIYFGPMGCRTGFYVIFAGDLKSEDILPVLNEAADFVLNYEGEIPGYSPRDCGNYLDNNLALAKIYMKKFKTEVLDNPTAERLNYPAD
jgi:S-ribosylhomocysteine lyase